jgi:hypothetical protein
MTSTCWSVSARTRPTALLRRALGLEGEHRPPLILQRSLYPSYCPYFVPKLA